MASQGARLKLLPKWAGAAIIAAHLERGKQRSQRADQRQTQDPTAAPARSETSCWAFGLIVFRRSAHVCVFISMAHSCRYFDWRQMALRERAARPGLQVLLEADGLSLAAELHGHNHGPWAVRLRVAARTEVVPLEARVDVVRDTDVVAAWIYVASENVDNALLDAVHV